jgi:anhydro-N-acetylmuramic acid kinase
MNNLYIGMMSGTSIDAVDAVAVNFDTAFPEVVAHYQAPFPETLKKQIIQLCHPEPVSLTLLGSVDHELGSLYADCVHNLLDKNGISKNSITAIGNHGQTIAHYPDTTNPFTLQIGNAHIIAAKTGIDTVADFRQRDVAVGGQGAPFAPIFHKEIFSDEKEDRVILNIGGMANITILNHQSSNISGFDTGPGNTLMDAWINHHHQQSYDHNGEWATQGKVSNDLLELLLNDPFFTLPPPKSTGREKFNLTWLKEKLDKANKSLQPEDVQATLLMLTAISIKQAITTHAKQTERVIVCGGGAYNPALMALLKTKLSSIEVVSTLAEGVDPQLIESMAFAWLAKQTIEKRPLDLRQVTGASKKTILGVIYPA